MFEKKIRTEKIIQFGEGGFLRGFVDWIVQLTNEASDFNASVVVVQPIEKGMCQKLEEQNCVYTHMMRGMKNGVPTVETKVIDVISRTVEPFKDFGAYLALAENPDFRFIVSNTTESGIEYKDTDKMSDAPAITFPAKLTLLLKKRYELGLPGFIFLPCELIDRNGDNLKACVLKYAELWGRRTAAEGLHRHGPGPGHRGCADGRTHFLPGYRPPASAHGPGPDSGRKRKDRGAGAPRSSSQF